MQERVNQSVEQFSQARERPSLDTKTGMANKLRPVTSRSLQVYRCRNVNKWLKVDIKIVWLTTGCPLGKLAGGLKGISGHISQDAGEKLASIIRVCPSPNCTELSQGYSSFCPRIITDEGKNNRAGCEKNSVAQGKKKTD